jgi:hypothetical protein
MTTLTQNLVDAPALDHDAARAPLPHTLAERRVIANLIAHLERAGFELRGASDGEVRHTVRTTKEALEVIFSVDDSWLYVAKPDTARRYTVYFVLGNAPDGSEVACDWSSPDLDVDGFSEAMDAFDFDEVAKACQAVVDARCQALVGNGA